MYETLDNKEVCVKLFKDLTKAFDMVNQWYFVTKIACIRYAHQWFVSYLKTRQQFLESDCLDVRNDDIKQKQLKGEIIKYEVPKGSILWPLLFLIYVNNIAYNISHDIGIKLTFFADDTNI